VKALDGKEDVGERRKGNRVSDHSCEVIISGCCKFYEIYTGVKLVYYYY